MTSSRRTSSPAPGSAASRDRKTADPWVTPRFSARRSRWATPASCSSRRARNSALALSRFHSLLGGVGRGVAMTSTSVSAGISRSNSADGLRTPALPAMKQARESCSSCARELRATWWATTWRRRIRVQRRRASPAPLVSRLARRTSTGRPSASTPVSRAVSESTTSRSTTVRPHSASQLMSSPVLGRTDAAPRHHRTPHPKKSPPKSATPRAKGVRDRRPPRRTGSRRPPGSTNATSGNAGPGRWRRGRR